MPDEVRISKRWSSFTKWNLRYYVRKIWLWVGWKTVPFSPFVDQGSPNLVCRREWPQFTTPFSNQRYLGDICNKVAKWRCWKLRFRPQNFRGEGPPKSDVDILWPYGDTSSWKVWCNSPNRSRRYQPKYTRFLANFRISGAKKLLRAAPSPMRCALASVRHPLPTAKFLGGNAS